MTFREKFPSVATLDSVIDAELSAIVSAVDIASGPLEKNYHRYNFWNRVGVGFLFFAMACFVLFVAALNDEEAIPWRFVSVMALLVIVSGLCMFAITRHMWQFSNNFLQVTQAVLYEQAFAILGLTDAVRLPLETIGTAGGKKRTLAELVQQFNTGVASPEQVQSLALLDQSELITEPRNTVVIDDMFWFAVNGGAVQVSELHVSHVTGSGKNRQTKEIFKGYFASYEVGRTLTAKTFVSTDGDRNGFGHQGFWSTVTEKDDVEETILEWNEFESLLHVATSDPVEARTILTPDIMSQLYDWWQGEGLQQNIRLAFLGSRLYVLFPSTQIHLFGTIRKITPLEIRKEIESITKPLLPILHLLETIRN